MAARILSAAVLCAALSIAACGGGEDSPDAGAAADGGAGADAGAAGDVGQTEDGGVDAGGIPSSRPVTTVKATLKPKLPLAKQDPALAADFGVYTMDGPGEPHQLRDDLGAAAAASGTPASKSFLYLGHTSDNHLIDFQSPNRLVTFDNSETSSAYRPQEGFGIRLLDRVVRDYNAFSHFRTLDALVVSGDAADNNQYDEVRFLIDTLDGKTVDPDSGGYSFSGDDNMCAPVQTAGLAAGVPWFYAIGNHDALMQGNFAVTPRTDTPDEQEAKIKDAAYYKKAVGDKTDGKIVCQAAPLVPVDLKPGTVNASDARRPLTHRQVLKEFSLTTSAPAGHGFDQRSIDHDTGFYTADIGEGGLVRLITYDSAYPYGVSSSEGCVNRAQFDDLLTPALEQAKADGVLVIVVSHHASWKLNEACDIKPDGMVSLLSSYPNVVLHLVGHSHSNSVTPHPAAAGGGLGYWEVQAPSTLDFPQQAHLVELVDDGDGTGSIYVTVFNHSAAEGSVEWKARALALLDLQTGDNEDPNTGDVSDRNVILKFLVPDAAKAKLVALPAKEVESMRFGE